MAFLFFLKFYGQKIPRSPLKIRHEVVASAIADREVSPPRAPPSGGFVAGPRQSPKPWQFLQRIDSIHPLEYIDRILIFRLMLRFNAFLF